MSLEDFKQISAMSATPSSPRVTYIWPLMAELAAGFDVPDSGTLIPVGPISPVIPIGPVSPFTPVCPLIPCNPVNPKAPLIPTIPVIP